MGSRNREIGRWGEDVAERHLVSAGYEIVCRNWSCHLGELDFVCRDGPAVVFVEVRARSGGGFGTPEESVDWNKRSRLIRLALAYLSRSGLSDRPCRFDVVAVSGEPGSDDARVRIIVDAFRP